MLVLVGVLITCEVVKQCANYGVVYTNGGKHPLPRTVIVALLESIKLVLTVIRGGGRTDFPILFYLSTMWPLTIYPGHMPSFSVSNLKASAPFVLPSLLYVFSNNAYFYGITLVSPPIWSILVSIKTFVSAVTYKVA